MTSGTVAMLRRKEALERSDSGCSNERSRLHFSLFAHEPRVSKDRRRHDSSIYHGFVMHRLRRRTTVLLLYGALILLALLLTLHCMIQQAGRVVGVEIADEKTGNAGSERLLPASDNVTDALQSVGAPHLTNTIHLPRQMIDGQVRHRRLGP